MTEGDFDWFTGLFDATLAELHGSNHLAIEHYRNQYSRERLGAFLEDRDACLAVAETEGAPAGFGVGRNSGGVGLIHWLGVCPQQRSRRVGSALLQYMMKRLELSGCHKLELYTYLDRPKLIDWYRSEGFAETATLENHYYHLDVVYMTKRLP